MSRLCPQGSREMEAALIAHAAPYVLMVGFIVVIAACCCCYSGSAALCRCCERARATRDPLASADAQAQQGREQQGPRSRWSASIAKQWQGAWRTPGRSCAAVAPSATSRGRSGDATMSAADAKRRLMARVGKLPAEVQLSNMSSDINPPSAPM